MADDPNSTKPRLPDHARAGSTSSTPRLAPTDPMWWPEDPYGLTFLARFVNEIGLRVFAASWTGTEAAVEEFDLLPKLAEATMRHRRRADDLLSAHRPDLERLGDVAFTRFQDNPEHWLIAQQLAKREHKEASPALSRRLLVVRTAIIRWSRAGELPLKICHVLGGLPGEFQPEWWDRPEPESLFYRCIIDPDDPFGRRPNRKTDNDHYIYAPREALDQIVIASPNGIHHPEAEPQLPRTGSVDPPKPPVREPITEIDLDEPTPEVAPTDAEQPDQPQAIVPFRSGGPGRPTAVEVVVREAKRRIEAGEVAPTQGGLTKYAEEIHLWWQAQRKKYPNAPAVSAKTLRNKLGAFWRSKIKRRIHPKLSP